jgi:hypothetical protein
MFTRAHNVLSQRIYNEKRQARIAGKKLIPISGASAVPQ